MRYKKFGKTDIEVSEIGLGTWEMAGDVYGKKDDLVSIQAIRTALEAGVNFIDTASGYGKGHAEDLIGKTLKDFREKEKDVVVLTKVLPKCGVFAPSSEKPIDDFYPPEYIIEQCEASLKRLQRDHIDILLFHTWSRSWGHRTEWYDAMVKLKQQGKIRAIGISIPDEGIADANVHIEAERVDVIECVYNIFQQEPEYTLFPLAQKHNVGIIARSPFSSGALTGTWTKDMKFEEGDWRGIWPKSVKVHWLEEQVDMAEQVRLALPKEKISMPVAAIKYILMNPAVTSVIPGSASPDHVEKNLSALDGASLSEWTIKLLKQLWVGGKIHGTYNGSI